MRAARDEADVALRLAARARDGVDTYSVGRAIGRGLGDGGQAYVWGVEYQKGAVYASDMIGGLWVLAPVSR